MKLAKRQRTSRCRWGIKYLTFASAHPPPEWCNNMLVLCKSLSLHCS